MDNDRFSIANLPTGSVDENEAWIGMLAECAARFRLQRSSQSSELLEQIEAALAALQTASPNDE